MDVYTGRIAIDRSAAEVYAFLADIRSMPRYLPTVRHVAPAGTDRVTVEGEAGGHAYRDEGFLEMEAETRRMRWGTEGEPTYRGELQVHEVGGRAEVELSLTLSPDRPLARRMTEEHGSLGTGMRMALQRTLGAIKSACEDNAGAAAAKDTTRSADDLPDSRVFGHSATLNPDI